MHYSFRFLLATVAVWRITHLLSSEDGPWNIVARLRRGLGSGMLSKLFTCFYCLSLWIAVPFVWFVPGTVEERIVMWLGLSGAAILLQRATGDSLEIQVEGE
jgi:hypothetical protein